MGFKTFGYGGGRVDIWEPEDDIYWGPEGQWLDEQRYSGERELHDPLAAVQMGLIYVNPQGPNGNPDPVASAKDIRETFRRMAMNDYETVALVAGGHTFGKAHGAGDAALVGAEPEGSAIEHQGFGWISSFESGMGGHTITSGIEGAWTATPTKWDDSYFKTLYGHEWELSKSPAGAHQWHPKGGAASDTVPDAHDPNTRHAPMMTTADLALRFDPAYDKISRHFMANPDEFADAFAKAWFKLTHRDMGPVSRYRGPLIPKETQIWQDPVPAVDHPLVDANDVASLKTKLLDSGITSAQLVRTAWAAGSTFRSSDKRGGANGARIRLDPQRNWAVNDPSELSGILDKLEDVRRAFNSGAPGGKRVSLADLIVLGGAAAIEQAAEKAGCKVSVPFTPGRTDASQEQTDIVSFGVIEPRADGFRNYVRKGYEGATAELLVDKAQLLGLSAPEMTVLVGGLRVLGANAGGSTHGVFTKRVGTLSNDFFVNLLDMNTKWARSKSDENVLEGTDRQTGAAKWTGTVADLVFGSNSQLRALAEVYGSSDGQAKFVRDFVRAWNKVMEADRFDTF
jgi:catalase-peroxidase